MTRRWFDVLPFAAALLVIASSPADGLVGVGLALAGVACSVTWLVLNRKRSTR